MLTLIFAVDLMGTRLDPCPYKRRRRHIAPDRNVKLRFFQRQPRLLDPFARLAARQLGQPRLLSQTHHVACKDVGRDGGRQELVELGVAQEADHGLGQLVLRHPLALGLQQGVQLVKGEARTGLVLLCVVTPCAGAATEHCKGVVEAGGR